MDFTRALVVALKIIVSNFLFGIILALIALSGNLIATVLLSFILTPVATALAVFFILEEAEAMMSNEVYKTTKGIGYRIDELIEKMKKEKEEHS